MKSEFLFYFFFFIINIIIFLNYKTLSKLINVFDSPDSIRKFHKKKVPLIGGTFLALNLVIFFIFIDIFNQSHNFFGFNFSSFKDSFLFLLIILFIYFLGLVDDKLDISAGQKIIFLSIFAYLLLSIGDDFLIKSLRFKSFNKEIDLFQFSKFFTLLSIIIFINAMNMFDGLNLQSSSYFFGLFIIFSFFNLSLLNILILIYLIFFMYFNFNEKIFLGDSGIYILSIIAAISLIYNYNILNLYVEDVACLVLFPIFDLLRLFFSRIRNNQNPLVGDRSHIHHIMLKKFDQTKVVLILIILATILAISQYIFKINFIIIFFIFIIIYSYLIKK